MPKEIQQAGGRDWIDHAQPSRSTKDYPRFKLADILKLIAIIAIVMGLISGFAGRAAPLVMTIVVGPTLPLVASMH